MVIQRLSTVSNGFGGYVENWTDVSEYDGILDQLSGNEKLSADKLVPNSTHILIGEVTDIKESDRILYNGKVYEVKNIDNPMNLDHHLEILLECKGDA